MNVTRITRIARIARIARITRISGVALVAVASIGCSSGGGSSAAPTTIAPTTTAPGGPATPKATLPPGWPAEVALPANAVLIEASQVSGSTQMNAKANLTGDTQAAFDELKARLTSAGYEIVGSTFTPSDKGGFGSISAKGTVYTAAIAFGPDETGKVSQINVSIAKVGS